MTQILLEKLKSRFKKQPRERDEEFKKKHIVWLRKPKEKGFFRNKKHTMVIEISRNFHV